MMKAKQQLPVVLFPPPVYFLLTLSLLWIHRDASAYAFVPHGPFVKQPTRKINSNALLWLSKTTIPIPESSVSINDGAPKPLSSPMGWIPSTLTKCGMMAFILSMCIVLPITLLPQRLLLTFKCIDRIRSEQLALETGQWCARWLMWIIPFCHIECIPCIDPKPEPAIWVINHTSMLDAFVLLAVDAKLRGKNKRPIKVIYWQQLEKNLVSKILFRQCGFIPVQMADNGNGNPIVYDPASFLPLMRHCKRAFEEGFDVAIFPEGQLNPHPELGLLPVFGSAFKLARKSQRNIHMIGLYGVHRLWHPLDGMKPTSRQIKVKVYPGGRAFSSQEEFCDTFSHVVGPFGSCGEDADDLVQWLDGSAYHDQHASGVRI